MTEDEVVGWHHRLDGHKFDQALGVGDGQGSLARCSPLPAMHLCPWGFSRQGYWRGLPSPLPEDLCNPGIEPRFPALQVDSLPSEPLGKPKNTGVGSLSLLQGVFPIQESNQGLLYCRQILYHLSHQGSPIRLRELV